MEPELVFSILSVSVLPAWILLILAPGWSWTNRLIHSVWVPGLLCLAYIWIIATRPESPEGAGLGSLKGIMTLFGSPYGALVAWVHFLAFDLFVGAWEVRDARRRGIHHGWGIPRLLGTFM